MAKKYQFDLTYPVDMMRHIVSQHWGENPQLYLKYVVQGAPLKGHNGTDIAPTDMQSHDFWPVDDGDITYVGWDPLGFGNYLDIQHSWGKSRYAHARAINVKVGQRAHSPKFGQAATILGQTGYTGYVMPQGPAGTHLHLGIYPTTEPKNNGYGGTIDPIRPDNYFTVLSTGVTGGTTPTTPEMPVPIGQVIIPDKGIVVVNTFDGVFLRPNHSKNPDVSYKLMLYGTEVNFTGETFEDGEGIIWGEASCWFAMKIGSGSLLVKNKFQLTKTIATKTGR